MALVLLHPHGLPAQEPVAVPPVLGRMHGEDGPPPPTLLDPDGRVRRQPVVRVHDVEAADRVLDGQDRVDEGSAHVVHFVDEVRAQCERAAVVVDPVDEVVPWLRLALPREDVDLVLAAVEGGGQLRDVDSHAAHRNRVK